MSDSHGKGPFSGSPGDEDLRAVPGQASPEYRHDLADDVMGAAEEDRWRRPRRRRSPVRRWIALLAAVAVVVIGGIVAVNALQPLVKGILPSGEQTAEDYEGEGRGEVTVVVPQGASGGEIGRVLEEAGVVASAQAFSDIAAADPRSAGLQPGTYRMREEMSSAAALELLLDPESRQVERITVREGLWASEIYEILAEATEHSVEDFENVDVKALDLPKAANGEVEGYLFPATYDFQPGMEPEAYLAEMVAQSTAELERLGVAEEDMERALIVASIVQGEGRLPEDLPKVARVIENRLEEGMPLQMDSTVHYIHQERGRAGTTDEQRGSDNPYNTYVHEGLPPGPINNPCAAAIEAAAEPAEGDWLYFVAVNPESGETKFADSYSEHLENQEEFQEWCRDHPDQC